ncbi:MAG: hypothetical protein LBG59_07405 [Candidatus Peribacteria bacterium]|nr:hypothetical protein [Candidatus Peribacteria bacterium]
MLQYIEHGLMEIIVMQDELLKMRVNLFVQTLHEYGLMEIIVMQDELLKMRVNLLVMLQF